MGSVGEDHWRTFMYGHNMADYTVKSKRYETLEGADVWYIYIKKIYWIEKFI